MTVQTPPRRTTERSHSIGVFSFFLLVVEVGERVHARAQQHICKDVTQVGQPAAQDHQLGRDAARQTDLSTQERNVLKELIGQSLPDLSQGLNQKDKAQDAARLLHSNVHGRQRTCSTDRCYCHPRYGPLGAPDVLELLFEDQHQEVEDYGYQAEQVQPQGVVEKAHGNLPVVVHSCLFGIEPDDNSLRATIMQIHPVSWNLVY